MYACCQRKDPKALTDYNLIESSRDQSRPLPLDLYTETASDDRKSFLRKACRPYSSTALESMRSTLVSLFFPFFFSCSSSSFLSIVSIFVDYFTTLHIRVYSKHAFPLLRTSFFNSRNCTISLPDVFHLSSFESFFPFNNIVLSSLTHILCSFSVFLHVRANTYNPNMSNKII